MTDSLGTAIVWALAHPEPILVVGAVLVAACWTIALALVLGALFR
jgi:hypothetical protein